MRRLLACIVLSLSAFTTPASSNFHGGEIVSMEWIGNLLDVRYSPATKMITCIAYNEQDKMVASGTGYPNGPVAKVLLSIPSPYARTNKIRVGCE